MTGKLKLKEKEVGVIPIPFFIVFFGMGAILGNKAKKMLTLRRSRVIGDFGGYRRLFAYLDLAAFGRGKFGRQCGGKGGCIGL